MRTTNKEIGLKDAKKKPAKKASPKMKPSIPEPILKRATAQSAKDANRRPRNRGRS